MHEPFGQSSAREEQPISSHIEAFLDVAPLPAIVIDGERTIRAASPAANELMSSPRESLVGRNLVECVRSLESIEWLGDQHDNAQPTAELCEFVGGNGTSFWAEIHARAFPDGQWLLLINDVSERRQAEKSVLASEKQRWKMQRIEALEKLAGGVAHEFNNFLAVILLQTDMLNLQLTEGSPIASRVEEIRAVSNDAASIVRQLLAFGRRQAMNPAPAVLNKVIELSARDFKALLGESIELSLDLAPELGVSFVDQNQIGQALMYLAVNAKEAMRGSGKLTIRTSNIDEGGPLIHKTQSSGSYIQLEVIDTGAGMDMKTEDHIFEPFFSTKGSNKTTGLSLATVWGIVKQSGGYIWVTSVQNSGTSFKIQFPRIDQPTVASRKPKQNSESGSMLTILLLEDENSVRKVAAEGLRRDGYRVLEASSGSEAIDVARTFLDPIHLVLADYAMSSMNGSDAAKRIQKFHPDAKVLFMTGDPSKLNGVDDFLSKPFSLSELTKKVGDFLNG